MVISIRTKTFKDAQSALSPVIFGVLFTAMAAAFVPPTGASLAYLIPVYGTSAIVGVLTLGGIVPANAVLFSIIGNLLATVVGIIFAMQIFNRERLLYSM
jgi:ABC-type Na+ efflux pump permease subunit